VQICFTRFGLGETLEQFSSHSLHKLLAFSFGSDILLSLHFIFCS
jgi:hypothetical protein